MGKKLALASLNGALVAIALEFLLAIFLSIQLRLGYFLPYPASLPEQVGGEMNAVILQTALCAVLGGGIGFAWRLARWKTWPVRRRALGSVFSLAVCALTAWGLVLGLRI